MLSESVTQAREDAKQKILEQHVAVTTRQEELRTIGGKKVCWNFREVLGDCHIASLVKAHTEFGL